MYRPQLLLLTTLLLLSASTAVCAPVQVGTCNNNGCVLTIPRYKMFMSLNNPNLLWVAYPNGSGGDFRKSLDGGLTWNATNPNPLQVKGYMDFHASISGDSQDNIYLTDPGPNRGAFWFRKIRAPGQSAIDLQPPLNLTSNFIPANVSTRTNVLAQDTNNIWLFFRTSDNDTGNVRYFRSRDGGNSFPEEGWVENVHLNGVRIGSLLIENQPAVIVHYMSYPPGDNIDYRYFIWNGTSFVRNIDADVVRNENTGNDREYSMSYVNGYMHMVYNARERLRHAWKRYGDGQATWHYADIETLPYDPLDWHPSLSKFGNELYLLYVRQETSTTGNNNVYLRHWNGSTQSWSAPTALTTQAICNRFPSSAQIITPSATHMPIIWTQSAASCCTDPNCNSGTIMSERYPLGTAGDNVPPAAPGNARVQ